MTAEDRCGARRAASVGIPIRLRISGLLAQRVRGHLGSVPQAELRQDVRDVVLGRSPADVEPLRDLGVRASFGQERQDLRLALRQRPYPFGNVRAGAPSSRSTAAAASASRVAPRRSNVLSACRASSTAAAGACEASARASATRDCAASRARPSPENSSSAAWKSARACWSPRAARTVPAGELGDGARPVVVAVDRKNGQLVERLFRVGEVAACELHLDKQGEHRRAIRIGRRRALKAQAAEVPCQSEVAACQRDPREQPLGARVPVEAFEQTFGLLESPLPNAQVREPKQREELGRPVARLEGPDRGQQLALRLFPAAECDQNPAVVRAARRRHEVAPGLETSRRGQPLLGASDVGRPFAGAQQPAVDLAGGADTRRPPPRRPRPSPGRAASYLR